MSWRERPSRGGCHAQSGNHVAARQLYMESSQASGWRSIVVTVTRQPMLE